jgi:asparagine synthase (glutamine-hydrolysing)
MCGFTAFLSVDGELAPAFQSARPWTDLFRHRGPDGEASYTAPGVGMHFVRLSILDLSERGMQPMRSRDGRYVLVFNGEIINFRALAAQHHLLCRSRSDSEVLVELWARLGEAVLPQLRGMFAFVIYDTLERTAVAARDPFGIKPLYYAQRDDLLMFASEMTPLLVALGGEVALDETRTMVKARVTGHSVRFRRATSSDGRAGRSP